MSTESKQAPEQVTHWKKLSNPLFVGAHDLQPNQELILEIESVTTEMVKGSDGKQSSCIIARFKSAKKPMILNKTNCKIISSVIGSPYIENWKGHKIIIYAAKVNAFGEEVEALRVKRQKPA